MKAAIEDGLLRILTPKQDMDIIRQVGLVSGTEVGLVTSACGLKLLVHAALSRLV